MNSSRLHCIILGTLLFTTVFTSWSTAQDGWRAKPAFPIIGDEKMLVIAPGIFDRGVTAVPLERKGFLKSDNEQQYYFPLHFPVGTTLKRLIVEVADMESGNLTIELLRKSNVDLENEIVLRSINSSNVSSSNNTDFKQLVSNPLTHTMMQGWTYQVKVIFPGSTHGGLVCGVIKVIYIP